MSIQRLVLLLIIVGALAIVAVENWSPMVSLVILGSQTQALPLGLWLIGAIAAGILTTLIVAGLAQISSGSSYSRQPRPRPSRNYQSSYQPASGRSQPRRDRSSDKQPDYSSTQTTAKAAPSTSAEKAKRRSGDDWETVGQPLQDWGGWGSDQRSSRDSYTQQAATQNDEKENPSWSDWNGYEVVDAEPIDVEPIDIGPVDAEPVDRYSASDIDAGADASGRDRNRSIWSNWRGYDVSDDEPDEDDSQSYVEENEYSYYYDSSNLDEEEDEEEEYDDREYDDREYDDDLDDLVDDWDDERDEVDDRDDDDADLRDRQITEVTREPTVRSQSGTIYSYSYRRSHDTGAGKAENIYQSDASDDQESEPPRVIIPPHHPSSDGSSSEGKGGITDSSEDNPSDDETDDPQENS